MAERIATRNARFQQWAALLGNRTKRRRAGQFLVQGVRPITLAVRHGWPVHALIMPAGGRQLSRWAQDLIAGADVVVEMDQGLLAELAEKDEAAPELVAVIGMPPDDLDRIPVGTGFLGVVFDRPSAPGNIGAVIRSADAFGADCLIVTGHAADVYDPKAVRASTGSLFALPVVRAESPDRVLAWARHRGLRLVGADESGSVAVDAYDLGGPTLLVIGNETRGMSAAWRTACDATVRIPIGGSASSLNAAAAATVILYEAARQRRRVGMNTKTQVENTLPSSGHRS